MNNCKDTSFALFETMLYRNKRIFLLKNHLQRILQSAYTLEFDVTNLQYFCDLFLGNFSFDTLSHYTIAQNPFYDFDLWNYLNLWDNIENTSFLSFCKNFCSNFYEEKIYILKLLLYQNAQLRIEIVPYNDIPYNNVMIVKNQIDSQNIFLYHKTTQREHYRDAADRIVRENLFDILYCNEKKQLCEGSRSNIVLECDGCYYTPIRDSGLLRGTLLSVILQSQFCKEKVLYLNDIKQAQRIFCLNSVRGIKEVYLKI